MNENNTRVPKAKIMYGHFSFNSVSEYKKIKIKELLLNSIVSKAKEFTSFSMNTRSDFDPWNLKHAGFLT